MKPEGDFERTPPLVASTKGLFVLSLSILPRAASSHLPQPASETAVLRLGLHCIPPATNSSVA
jgi:hypothetical protein